MRAPGGLWEGRLKGVGVIQHPQSQQFQVRVEQDGPGVVLRLSGEMDIACAEAFDDALRASMANGSTDVLVDLSDLTFIDSSGLRMLIELWDRSRGNGLDVSILQGTGQVRRTLEIAGLDSLLPIVDRRSSRA
jgi:anti-anti-sigma factor